MAVTVELDVGAKNQTFDLVGYVGETEYFRAKGQDSGDNATKTVRLEALDGQLLPDKIGKIEKTFAWKVITPKGTYDLGSSGPHVIYVIISKPTQGVLPSLKRMEWAVAQTTDAASSDDACKAIQGKLAKTPGFGSANSVGLSGWVVAAAGEACDCISLSKAAAAGINMVGIWADVGSAYTTTDAQANENTCKTELSEQSFPVTVNNVTQLVRAKLYFLLSISNGPGVPNAFEGYFWVFGGNAKPVAYTVVPPKGPFSTAYFRLQVLRGATTTQYWICVDNYPQLSLNSGDKVPNPPCPAVPVPPVPTP